MRGCLHVYIDNLAVCSGSLTDIGSTIVSVVPPNLVTSAGQTEDGMNNKFVATLRCQGQEKRVSVTLRPTEGEYGELSMTVVATLTPKVAKVGTHWRLPATM
jgi:hypothetical protein